MKKPRHFLSITDLSAAELMGLFSASVKLKKMSKKKQADLLATTSMAMIFEKPSLRTRISFEAGLTQLGGHAIYLGPSDIGMGKRESVADIAKVTSSMVDIIMARTFKHESIEELAKYASVPVINALSDLEHPCQILADLMTILEVKKKLSGLLLVYVGDAENNVAHSLCLGCAIVGMNFTSVSPRGYKMKKEIVNKAREIAKKKKLKIFETDDPKRAFKSADVVVTDTWVSMGDEAEKKKRLKIFKTYQVNEKLMRLAKKDAIFMHCLPAYRGKEVTAEIIDGPQSVVFQEAENRLHAQKALICYLLRIKI